MISRGHSAATVDTAVIVAARRTPIATSDKGLALYSAADLAAAVFAALATDTQNLGLIESPDDIVLGNARGPGGNIARVAALQAGLGDHVPGVTVDRQCGSGLEAIRLGTALVSSGVAPYVLAGGAESASQSAPGKAIFAPAGWADPEMGPAADDLADRYGIPRETQDRYAAQSHTRAVLAMEHDLYAPELVTVGDTHFDDRPRPRLTAEKLSRFRPAFSAMGTATAGNSCGINDGAAAVAMITETQRQQLNIPGLRILATHAVGVDPALPGRGPAPAIRAALAQANLNLDDVASLEVTEAFASVLLGCTQDLGLDPFGSDADRISVDGGAIALGHPWGASGTLLMVRLFSQLVRRGMSRNGRHVGVAACAIGGGAGLAVVVEAVPAA